jgi:hypothetical protein
MTRGDWCDRIHQPATGRRKRDCRRNQGWSGIGRTYTGLRTGGSPDTLFGFAILVGELFIAAISTFADGACGAA